jgi:hypothetical protein
VTSWSYHGTSQSLAFPVNIFITINRPDLYPDKTGYRARRLLLMQIALRETLRLRQRLLVWPQVEMELFLRKILDILWCVSITNDRCRSLISIDFIHSSLPQYLTVSHKNMIFASNTYFSEQSPNECHAALPLIDFVCQLAEQNVSMSQTILNAGFLDVLLQVHIDDNRMLYSSGADRRACRFAFQIACHSALDALGRQGSNCEFIRQHPINTMWPQVVDLSYLQFCGNPIQAMAKRQSLWRRLDRRLVVCRHRALEAAFDDQSFYEMADYFDTCIDLIEFSTYAIHYIPTYHF